MRRLTPTLFVLVVLSAAPAVAQPPGVVARGIRLTPDEERVSRANLDSILKRQLPDGTFRQLVQNDTVWASHYFNCYAAQALLAGYERWKVPAYLDAVRRYLEWCVLHQTPDGIWTDCEGTIDFHPGNGKTDAWDSSVSMYLVVVERYRQAGGVVTQGMADAAKRAFTCLVKITDPADGLTWSLPNSKTKYCEDNVESLAGSKAAVSFFAAVGAPAESALAHAHAVRVAAALPHFWMANDGVYATAKFEGGAYQRHLNAIYPDCQVQLFGIAYVQPELPLWKRILQKFKPDGGPSAAAGPERWLIAASRIGGADEKFWRAQTVREAASFTDSNVYIARPAVAVLGLLEGADSFFNLATGKIPAANPGPNADPDPKRFAVSCELLLPPGSRVVIPPDQVVDVFGYVIVGNSRFGVTVGAGSFWLTNPAKTKLFMAQKQGEPELPSYQFGIDEPGLLLDGVATETCFIPYQRDVIKRIAVTRKTMAGAVQPGVGR